MSAVNDAIAEVQAALAAIAPVHEGLRDFARLNIKEATLAEINFSIEEYDRRVALLNSALAALKALASDGHPDLPVREIQPEALADLKENESTIEAALGIFASSGAVSLGLGAGKPEIKPLPSII